MDLLKRYNLVKSIVAAVSLAAVIISAFLSSAPNWHAHFHIEQAANPCDSQPAGDSGHHCAATLFAKGMVESDLPVPILPEGPLSITKDCPSIAVHYYLQPEFTLLPGRAPPVS